MFIFSLNEDLGKNLFFIILHHILGFNNKFLPLAFCNNVSGFQRFFPIKKVSQTTS